MIEHDHRLPVARQAQLLALSRSSVYYRPRPTADEDLVSMRRIDELYLEHPFAGSRMMRDFLKAWGYSSFEFSFDSWLAPLSKRVTPPFATSECQIR